MYTYAQTSQLQLVIENKEPGSINEIQRELQVWLITSAIGDIKNQDRFMMRNVNSVSW